MSARMSGPSVKQLTFDWKAQDKYSELSKIEVEVENIFMTKSYDTTDSESLNSHALARTWRAPFCADSDWLRMGNI